MTIQYIANIAEVLEKETKIYFVEHENIDIIDTINWESDPFRSKISLVNITGKLNITILLCVEEELFQALFSKYFSAIDENEKDELEDAFTDELLNLIAGISMRHFPSELDDSILGVPYKLSLGDIKSIFVSNKYQTKTLSTKYGNIDINIVEN